MPTLSARKPEEKERQLDRGRNEEGGREMRWGGGVKGLNQKVTARKKKRKENVNKRGCREKKPKPKL